MKRTIYLLILCGFVNSLLAQTSTENYVTTKTYTKNDNSTAITQIQYVDGLGRPIETVVKAFSPLGKDLVTTVIYDGNGREWQNWLPASSPNSDGRFIDVSSFQATQITTYDDNKPYAQTNYEPSPLNIVTGQLGAGAVWHDNQKKDSLIYATNTLSEVKYFFADDNNQLIGQSTYLPNTLYKITSKDEDGKQTIEYKDKLGRVVLQRNGNADFADTYYVYNDLGQLCYVIPPLAADVLGSGTYSETTDVIKKYGYVYKYDERGNCNYKKLPGCEPIYMIYDKANRLVLSQDGNQRTKPQWTITKYDILGRVLYTGVINREIAQSEKDIIHNNVIVEDKGTNNQLLNTGYTCNTFINEITPLTVNYYDAYNYFLSLLPITVNTNLTYLSKSGYSTAFTTSHPSAEDGLSFKGLLTGTRTYLLDGSGNYTVSVNYYDDKGRVVQSRSTNHLGGYDIVYNELDFTGKPSKTLKEHNIALNGVQQPIIPELYTYDYDHAGRLLKTKYQINNKPEVILTDMTTGGYDELGRLKIKKRHNGTDTESFVYNIRNWTTKITSGSFEENLSYNIQNLSSMTPVFNGNISAVTWKYGNTSYAYSYTYDNLNRLTKSQGYQAYGTYLTNPMYTEEFNYDKQGNIQTLKRQRSTETRLTDYLNYYYSGNQVNSIADYCGSLHQYSVKEYQDISGQAANEMAYDPNGNLIKDLDRDIVTIKYNLLNLPEIIQFKYGNQIINKYDAGGQKLETRYVTFLTPLSVPLVANDILQNIDVTEAEDVTITGTSYVGNFEYGLSRTFDYDVTNAPVDNRWLSKVYNAEGYTTAVTYQTWGPIYNYYRKDHLGNNREVWQAAYNRLSRNFPATTTQATQYYPSGLPWAESTGQSTQNKKYNGKEFVEAHGLDEYDSEARWYYPAIMRTTTPDPLAEKYYSISPYAWCGNNPVNAVDPDGRKVIM